MTSDHFVFWLQSFFELSQPSIVPQTLNEGQVEEIKSHLNLVVTKATPDLTTHDNRQLTLPFFNTTSAIATFSHTGD